MSDVVIPLATVGISRLEEKLKALKQGIPAQMVDAIERASLLVEREVKQKQLSGRRGTRTGLDVDTGQLRASFSSSVFVVGERVVGIVGSPSVYSRIHESGGEIRPKAAKALAIPLTPEAKINKPRQMGDLFVWQNQDTGKAFLARSEEGGGLTLHYFLTGGVTIPARKYLTKAQQAVKKDVVNLVGKGVSIAIQKADKRVGSKGTKEFPKVTPS